jgi:acetylornithine/succinyldiaminopimelate/putrescine aminotransferase
MACAIALTVMDVAEREKLADNIRARGEELKRGLQALVGTRGIQDVRGYGGLIGLVVADETASVIARLAKGGLILIPAAHNTVRFLPPLNVTADEIAEALRIVGESL